MTIIDLQGEWQITAKNHPQYSVTGKIPGDNLTALYQANLVPDPFYGKNELDLQWIGQEDWTFSRSFSITESCLQKQAIFLELEGVDTVADILINGHWVGHTENMFRRYVFSVKPFLKVGENQIQIEIQAPEKVAQEKAKQLPYPIPYSRFPVSSPHRNLLRKVQCHGGWDWGPCLMVSGIMGKVRIIATNDLRLDYVLCRQEYNQDCSECQISLDLEYEGVRKTVVPLTIYFGEIEIHEKVKINLGYQTHRIHLTIAHPKLWWPHGEGDPHLYPLKVRFGSAYYEQKIGLRKMEILYPDDEHGRAFIVQVNNRPIFCRGADWIPADALPGRITEERLNNLLDSAVKVNMNMLRVWGGGQYESDTFYRLCDEKGIMIWQDFMFACALYPATPDFLENVRAEAEHQVKRLMNYASIALWCGNNENLGALGWYEESKQNRDRYLVDYDRLNEGILGNTVRKLDPSRCFWPSSPCAGPQDYTNTFHDPKKGDMHYWGVWHGSRPFESYLEIVPRFCSEFGFQSFPSLETIRSFAPQEEWNPTAPIMEHHQRCHDGNTKILTTMCRYFRVPKTFADFVYLSQLQQALAIRMGVEHWRRHRPICMGTIIWQLNDNWPVASWSTLEYSGKWKLIHFMAQRFYAPILPSAMQKGTTVELWLTSDLPNSVRGSYRVEIYNLEGNLCWSHNWDIVCSGASSQKISEINLDALGIDPQQTLMMLYYSTSQGSYQNFHLFTVPKQYQLPDPHLTVELEKVEDSNEIRVTLRSEKPTFLVWLDTEGITGQFQESGWFVLPSQPWNVLFSPTQPHVSLKQFQRALRIYHLQASYWQS